MEIIKLKVEIFFFRSMLLILAGLWLVCSLLICLPFLTLCEELGFGFDRRTGKCMLVYCDKCNGDQSDIFLGGIIDIIVIATPFIVMVVSYIAVFIKLQRNYTEDDITTKQYKVSTFVLTFCYAIFIIPNAVLSWISPEVKNVSKPFSLLL